MWEGIRSARTSQRSTPPPAKDGGFYFGFTILDSPRGHPILDYMTIQNPKSKIQNRRMYAPGALPRVSTDHRAHAAADPQRGQHAARSRPAHGRRPGRARAAPEVRGHEP